MNRFFIHRSFGGNHSILVCSHDLSEYVGKEGGENALITRVLSGSRAPAPTSLSVISSYVEIPASLLLSLDELLLGVPPGRDVLSVPEIAAVAYNPPRGPHINLTPPPTNHKIGVPKHKLP